MQTDRQVFTQGIRDGIPIGIGYFAVAFALGITARDCGFNAFQGLLSSYTAYTSTGQYVGYTLYAAGATLAEVFIMMVITNARYMLMGFALNQRIPEGTSLWRRLLSGWSITDEIFGLTIARPGYINPFYGLGAWVLGCTLWSTGAMLGIVVGNILPLRVVSALSVALFGMFLAIIIPPARKDKVVLGCIAASFLLSLIATCAPGISTLSSGNRIILLTLVISSAAALLFPVKSGKEDAGHVS